MSVLDDSDDNEDGVDEQTDAPPEMVEASRSKIQNDISDDESFRGGDDADVKEEAVSDRDSWEEVTPPTSPLNASNLSSSTPKKATPLKKFHPFSITAASSSEAKPGLPSPSKRRDKCQFGKDCYRKNPAHFKDSCHPGDADWVEEKEEEEEENDDDDDEESQKPECEYGADCYRFVLQSHLVYQSELAIVTVRSRFNQILVGKTPSIVATFATQSPVIGLRGGPPSKRKTKLRKRRKTTRTEKMMMMITNLPSSTTIRISIPTKHLTPRPTLPAAAAMTMTRISR